MKKLLNKFLYLILAVLLALIFAADVISFYSGIQFTVISYFREVIILLMLFVWFRILKHRLHFDELSIQQNLIRLLLLVGANYFIYWGLSFLITPEYSDTYPPVPLNPEGIFISTLSAITAVIILIPIILILRQLIFYKRKRFTLLQFQLFLGLTTLLALSVFVTVQPLGFLRFTKDTLSNDLLLTATVVLIFLLSFRNEWITYLPRKKKLIYSLVGIPLYIGIVGLFDVIYKKSLPAYSLSLAALTYTMWIFLVVYGGLALLKLLFHLPTARAFDRKIKELDSLYTFGRKLSQQTELNQMFRLTLELTTEVLEADVSWLLLFDEKSKIFELAAYHELEEEKRRDFPFRFLDGLNQHIAFSRQAILISDLSHNRQYRYYLKWHKDLKTILGAPLFNNRNKLLGIIYAAKFQEYSFDSDDISLLSGLANQAAISIENAKLLRESIQKERLEQELKIARDVQMKLLPQNIPSIPGFELDAYCLSAYEVGGDYYDFFRFEDGMPGLVIGDVSGKGTSAALYMAEFKGIVQSLAQKTKSPAELARSVNRIVYPNMERKSFVTAIFAKLLPSTGELTFARAGHPPIIVCGENGKPAQTLECKGLGIGLNGGNIFDAILEEHTVSLTEGQAAVFYTDGLIEARNEKGEEYGEERLGILMECCRNDSIGEMKERLLNSIIEFCDSTPLHDDLTFVIIRRKESS